MKSKLVIFIAIISSVFLVSLSGCNGDTNRVKDEIPVFLYHSVKPELGEGDSSSMVVTISDFEDDLKYLKDNGYTSIDLDTLKNSYTDPDLVLPEKPFVITFDDGYLDNYEYAYPLLKKYDTQAVIYTIIWSVGRDRLILSDAPITPHFTWEQAKEMVDSGIITLGSHTYDLHNPEGNSYGYGADCGYGLGEIDGESQENYYNRIYGDLKRSKELIEENIGTKVSTFAYPYGIYNDTVIEVLKDLGFDLAFITESNSVDKSVFEISRKIISNEIRISDVLGK